MRSTFFMISSLVALATAYPYQLQFSPGFYEAGKQGCISSSDNADGAPVVIHDCNNEDVSKHSWELGLYSKFPAGPEQIKLAGTDKCIDVTDGNDADGTKLQLWTCVDGSRNQMWTSVQDNTFRWADTDKCIDVPDGSSTDGTQLQIWSCTPNNRNQQFSGHDAPNTESRPAKITAGPYVSGQPQLCLGAESDTDGAAVALVACDNVKETFPAGNRTWVAPIDPLIGPIKTYGGSKCLQLTNGDTTNGNKLTIGTCVAGAANQQWRAMNPLGPTIGSLLYGPSGQGKCADIVDGKLTTGNPIQVWDCDFSNTNQEFFVYPLSFDEPLRK
ncbi:ricin B-like lectin [Marasmius fiardii PR-910]|nr:ricin B-like lectin [Marasmius fiardii PR-910]